MKMIHETSKVRGQLRSGTCGCNMIHDVTDDRNGICEGSTRRIGHEAIAYRRVAIDGQGHHRYI